MLKDNDFLKVEQFIEWDSDYFVTCIISPRGLGKTHSALVLAEEITKNDGKFVVTRLNDAAFKKFKDDIEKVEGWKCSLQGQTIKKDGSTIAYLSSINTYANSKGGTYPDVKFMVFDEFNEDIYIENAFAKFVMLVDSFKRHRKDFACVLLGNMINKNNWFLNAMGLRIDWKREDDQVFYLKEYGVKVVVIGSASYRKLNEERQQINKLASADAASTAFYNEREFLNDETDMVTNFNKWVKPTFTPLFSFRYLDNKYVFGVYTEQNGFKYFFTDRWSVFYSDYTNIKEFSFDLMGNTNKNSKILEDDDIEDVQQKFFQIAKQNRMVYGSFEAYEDLKRFIALGSIF